MKRKDERTEDEAANKKNVQREVQTLTNSYLMVDPNKLNGVLPRLYNFTDYNQFSKPTDDIDISTGEPVAGNTSIPDPIIAKRIQLPDGDTTVTALGWAATGEQNSGWIRVGVDDYQYLVNGSPVTEWLAGAFRINYLTQGSVLFSGASGLISQDNTNFFWDDTLNQLQLPGTKLGSFAANTTGPYDSGTDNARIGEGRALGQPTGTITTVAAAGGLTGTFKYAYIEWDVSGNHTALSAQATVVAVANQYTVTVPRPRGGVMARSLCRTKAGGSVFYLLHNFASGDHVHQTDWVDNTADGSLVDIVADTDSTMMYKYVSNTGSAYGGSFLATHPDQQIGGRAVDLSVITADPTTGSVSMDCYAGISARAVTSPALATRITGTDASAYQYVAYYLGITDDGTGAIPIFSISPQGAFTLSPDVTGITNPSWFKLTGSVAGNYIVGRLGGTNAQAGLYVSSSSEPYFGSNINYSSGDTYSASTTAPWRMGNPTADSTYAWNLWVAAAGTSGNAITWKGVLSVDTSAYVHIMNGTTAQQLRVYNTYTSTTSFETLQIDWTTSANVASILVKKGGGGGSDRAFNFGNATNANLNFITNNTTHAILTSGGNFLLFTNTGGFYFGASSDAALTRVSAGVIGFSPNGSTIHNRISSTAAQETVFNDQQADIDFRVEGDNFANLFFIDASVDRISSTISDALTTAIYDFNQASTGDAAIKWTVAATAYVAGIDNSDSDKFKICASSALGTNDFLSITSTGSVICNSAAIATTATDGFLYVPTCAGAPTGVPTTQTGRIPLVVDSTNNKLYFYSGGAWRDAGP